MKREEFCCWEGFCENVGYLIFERDEVHTGIEKDKVHGLFLALRPKKYEYVFKYGYQYQYGTTISKKLGYEYGRYIY